MAITSPEALANALRQARKQRNLTQAELGELAGTKQSTVSALENTPESSKIDTLFKLLSGLGLEICIEPRSRTDSGNEKSDKVWDQEW